MNIDGMKKHWYPACTSKELRNSPLAVTLFGLPVVVFRTDSGVAALADVCPHRNVPLSGGRVKDGRIVCPYHGWEFDGEGVCRRVPGLHCSRNVDARAEGLHAAEQNGLVWVCVSPEKPVNQPFAMPWMEDRRYYSFTIRTSVRATLANTAENFLDATHTHYIHAGLIRSDSHRQLVQASLKAQDDHVEIRYSGEGKQSGIISKWFERERNTSFGRFFMPAVAQIEYRSSKGLSLMITALVRPSEAEFQDIYAVITMRRGIIPNRLKRIVIMPFLNKALKQDIDILEKQQSWIERQGKASFHSTQADMIRPYVEQLLEGRTYSKPYRREIELWL